MELLIDVIESPIGDVTYVSDGKILYAVEFAGYEDRMAKLMKRHYGDVSVTRGENPAGLGDALTAYFDGKLGLIDRIQVADIGSPFQRKVWRKLREIPCGETWSYGELAKAIGKPSASRAVGLANGSNPIPIVVPCHRVIGANGSLTGFGGGMERKQWLLAHEGIPTPGTLDFG